MDIRNSSYGADGRIDCEVKVDGKWVPFTARYDDVEEFGRRVYSSAVSGSPYPYVEPDPLPPPTEAEVLDAERADMRCSPLQGKLALGKDRWAQVEGIASDTETPFAMRIAPTSAVEWVRNSQMMDELAWMTGLSATEVDDIFREAVTLEV